MGCFFSRVDNTGVEQWWIKIVGKGNKERIIPVSEELLEEARAYRRAIGLSSTPFQGESFPLVGSLTSKFEKLGRGAVHVIVKSVFEKTANRLEGEIDLQKRRLAVAETQQLVEEITERVRSFESRITRLRSASAHWLRHTAGSKMARTGADLLHVRDNLGHSTLATTSIYLHTEDDARHRATTQGSRLDW
jgi:site-specific recombinase XerD